MTRLFVCLLALVFALPASAQNYPDYTSTYVNDFAGLISPMQEDRIEEMLIDLRNDHGVEFTVVTIHRMSDYGHFGAIEPFATGLFNRWGVGNAVTNDGVMMLVSRFDREMRIEVGAAYGTSKNAPMKRIIDNTLIPEFKDNRYGAGIEQGVRAVIADLTGAWPGEDTLVQKAKGKTSRFLKALGFGLIPIGIAGGGFGFWLWRRSLRYRARRCPVDGSKMDMLAEHWDDQHLKPGQIREEQLESVDYDVWECRECDHRTVIAYKPWYTKYGACKECQYKTLEGDTTIMTHATTSSTGQKRIDYSCHNCDAAYSVTKTIPRVTKSSSSSSGGSSSSSSFGGGSSSGGGASGSW